MIQSMASRNKNGDRRHPCLTSFVPPCIFIIIHFHCTHACANAHHCQPPFHNIISVLTNVAFGKRFSNLILHSFNASCDSHVYFVFTAILNDTSETHPVSRPVACGICRYKDNYPTLVHATLNKTD